MTDDKLLRELREALAKTHRPCGMFPCSTCDLLYRTDNRLSRQETDSMVVPRSELENILWNFKHVESVCKLPAHRAEFAWMQSQQEKIAAMLAGKDAVPLTSPSVAPADSESGSAVGPVGAAPGLPEFPTVFRTILPDAIAGQYESIVRGADYDTLRTVTLLAIKERDGAWAALRDAYYGVGSHDSAAWQKKHAATIAAARRGGMRIIAGLIFFAPVFALIIGMIGGIVCVIAIVSVVPS